MTATGNAGRKHAAWIDYFVFFPNARGSYGEGETFTQANRRDWGFGDLRDILAGVNAVVERCCAGAANWQSSYGQNSIDK